MSSLCSLLQFQRTQTWPVLSEVAGGGIKKKALGSVIHPGCFFSSGLARWHAQLFVADVVICSHVKDGCDFWLLLRRPPVTRLLLSCGFFNVLLNRLNGQLGLCEGIINISCQGIKTVFLPFSSLILALAWKAQCLWEVSVTQCCRLPVRLGNFRGWLCMQSLKQTAGGRVQSAAERKGSCV